MNLMMDMVSTCQTGHGGRYGVDWVFLSSGFGLITRKMVFHLPGGATWEPNFEIFSVGVFITLISIVFWAIEGPGGYHLHPEEDKTDS